jgi:hypothetical protein
MKIRIGFVSNSSNTSFCIFGKYVSYDKYKTLPNTLDTHSASQYNFDEDYVVGLSPERMINTETVSEFKERVRKMLSEALNEEVQLNECCWHINGWYDG